MKAWKFLLVIFICLLLACGAYLGLYLYDVRTHTGTLELQTSLSVENPGSQVVLPGETVSFALTTQNAGYSPVTIRQVICLSVYGPDGSPLMLDGTAWTAASLDLVPGSAESRTIWKNHAAFETEYRIGPGEQSYPLPFLPDPFDGTNTAVSGWSVFMDPLAAPEYANCIAVVDIFMEGTASDIWQPIFSESVILGSDTAALQHQSPKLPASPTEYTGYQWEVRNGTACLTGLGSVLEPDLFIPAQITLTEVSGQYWEDPAGDRVYDVTVAGDAFFDCDSIRTVTFSDSVEIENGQMYGKKGGMFEDCDAITAVYEIPDTVFGMANTFSGCDSLAICPELPASVTDLSGCFSGCTSLSFVPAIPDRVTNLYNTFKDCTALTTAPALPEGLIHMTYCFDGCTGLENAPSIPSTVQDLNSSFRNCTSLVQAPVIPDSVTSMKDTFSGCSALKEVPRLSASLVNMYGTFRDCVSLEKSTPIPATVTIMQECFMGCSNLSVSPVLPEGVSNLSKAFMNCTSLSTAPYLPDSAADLRFCFSGCTSLSGSVSIPNLFPVEFALLFRFEDITGIVNDCPNLDVIQVRYCDGRIDPQKFSKEIPVEFVGEHQDGTLCPICRFANLTAEMDGITIVIDDIQQDQYELFMDCFNNQIPDWLKAYCASMTFTDDLNQYTSDYKGPTVQGFATWPEGDTYIKNVINAYRPVVPYVMFHELAHTYDMRYSTYGHISGSDEWIDIHAEEGDWAASVWYGSSYNSMPLYKQRKETFAIAVGKYYTDRISLERTCPRMYEYIQNLVEENQSESPD